MSGSVGEQGPALEGRTAYVANLVVHGDAPDADLRSLEGNLATSMVLRLLSFFDGSADVLVHAPVGPLLSAFLHTTVKIGSLVGERTRVHAGSSTTDYKGLLEIGDRNGIRGENRSEFAAVEEEARTTWHGDREGSWVRGRDDTDQDTEARAESRARQC